MADGFQPDQLTSGGGSVSTGRCLADEHDEQRREPQMGPHFLAGEIPGTENRSILDLPQSRTFVRSAGQSRSKMDAQEPLLDDGNATHPRQVVVREPIK